MEQRKQALLNEYKGNLFEFLTAIEISRFYKIEQDFIAQMPDALLRMLKQQESFIRSFFPELLVSLPKLAKTLADDITEKLCQKDQILQVKLIGKIAMASGDEKFAEADILLIGKTQTYPVSIKLNKSSAMTNTKSAGVKSFIQKYFYNEKLQRDINEAFDREFDRLVFELHDQVGLEADKNFNQWVIEGHPQLPGELEGKERELYLNFLYTLTKSFYDALKELYKKESFIEACLPLIGFSRSDIIQAACFYKKDYSYASSYVHAISDTNLKSFEFLEFDGKRSYFEIKFANLILQIRVKAMNKFINKSFKINCSTKYL